MFSKIYKMNGRRKTYRRRPAKSTKRTYKKRVPRSTAIARVVKREIHRNIENKQTQFSVQNFTLCSYVNQPYGLSGYPMTPYATNLVINQGTGQGDRVGNTIRTRKLMLSYVIWPAAYNATTNPVPSPQEVKIWFGHNKVTPLQPPDNTQFAKFFQAGDTSQAPVSTLQDMLSSVNTDTFCIKKIVRHKVGFSNMAGTGGSAGNQYHANNDFKLNVVNKIDLTKYCSKVFKFNDTSATSPTSGTGLFMMITCVDALNGTPALAPLKMSYWLDYVYEDA